QRRPVRRDLIESARVVKPSVRHRETDVLRILNPLQRLALDEDQVREHPGTDRAEALVETERLRAAETRAAKRLVRRQPALREHPRLPVVGEPLQLTVRADLDVAARAQD